MLFSYLLFVIYPDNYYLRSAVILSSFTRFQAPEFNLLSGYVQVFMEICMYTAARK